MQEEKLQALQKKINKAESIVFFGGAGVSTESGIPDFRGVDGLYRQKYKYPPERIISHSFFVSDTEEFYRFYKDKMLVLDAEPNPCHYKLAELEKAGKVKAVVTQNIDGLHQKAGSSTRCGKFFDSEYIKNCDGIPRCDECGGIVKPDVVLYEEALDGDVMSAAVNAIAGADMLIIGGTSLVVYPAAGLIDYFSGNDLVVINKSPTGRDDYADLVITDPIGEVFDRIEV